MKLTIEMIPVAIVLGIAFGCGNWIFKAAMQFLDDKVFRTWPTYTVVRRALNTAWR